MPPSALGNDADMDLRPLDLMTAQACEQLAADLRSGKLTVLKFSVMDEERFGIVVEAMLPTALIESDDEPTQPGRPAAKRPQAGCPSCGSLEVRDAGDGYLMCLGCNLNWSAPRGDNKKE